MHMDVASVHLAVSAGDVNVAFDGGEEGLPAGVVGRTEEVVGAREIGVLRGPPDFAKFVVGRFIDADAGEGAGGGGEGDIEWLFRGDFHREVDLEVMIVSVGVDLHAVGPGVELVGAGEGRPVGGDLAGGKAEEAREEEPEREGGFGGHWWLRSLRFVDGIMHKR